MTTIGYIVGSLSESSINRTLARALMRLAPEGWDSREISIGDLPLYNRDLEGNYPAAAHAFKEALAGVDALVVVTPEYNRSIPGALKNALDWGSRPRGASSFSGVPAGIIGAALSPLGTAIAQSQLRTIMSALGTRLMGNPEAYITFRPEAYGANGEILEDALRGVLQAWMDAFVAHVELAPRPGR